MNVLVGEDRLPGRIVMEPLQQTVDEADAGQKTGVATIEKHLIELVEASQCAFLTDLNVATICQLGGQGVGCQK